MSLRDRFQPDHAPAADPRAETRAASALAGKRGRLRAQPAPPAGKAVAAILRPLLRETGLGLHEIRRRWADIAGPAFARAAPEKLAAGVLTVRAPSALAPFLQQQAPLLIERLRVAGAKVKTVRVDHRAGAPASAANVRPLSRKLSASEETALAQTLDPVADAGLKSALLRLGRAVKQG